MLKRKVRFFVKTFSDIVDLRLQGLRLCIMERKESCVFWNTEQSVKNMRRHITLYCDKARAECPGGDLLQEWERRTAKKKGFGNMLLFARKNTQKVRFNSLITDDRIDKQQIFGCALRKPL